MTKPSLHERAVQFTMGVLRGASDWQEGQDALANQEQFEPLFRGLDAMAVLSEIQAIVREAEERLGDELGY